VNLEIQCYVVGDVSPQRNLFFFPNIYNYIKFKKNFKLSFKSIYKKYLA
jgi:hypothetical protein